MGILRRLSKICRLFRLQVPTCCSCHVQGYSFNFPPRGTESQETSPHPEHFPGADFAVEDHGIQQQNPRPNEGFKAEFAEDSNLRPPLLTNSEQFHDESFSHTFNQDKGIRGQFNTKQITSGGQFQSDTTSNKFLVEGHREQFNFKEDRTRNQFHFQNDDTRNKFQEDNSRQHFQGEMNSRPLQQSPKRETVHLQKSPEYHVTPPPSTFQISNLFQRQGFRHPTPEGLVPPAGPPLPLAHETDFQTFSGNKILRRSRNQTSNGLR